MTKALAKRLPKMTEQEVTDVRYFLETSAATERNPCIRSSLNERIRLCNRRLTQLREAA